MKQKCECSVANPTRLDTFMCKISIFLELQHLVLQLLRVNYRFKYFIHQLNIIR